MSLKRVLRYFNIAVAIILAGAAVAVYWFAYRPLPDTSGEARAFIGGPGAIERDSLGTPHIRAATEEDALFLQGYATAQDRLWQMDALRRMAGGELAEVVGPSGLESDREARLLRLPRIAEEAVGSLPPADRAVFAAYARGVNAFIEQHRGRLPLEFTLMGYQPRPWRISDSILVGLHMIRTLSSSWRTDLLKQEMLAAGDRAKVEFLFPVRSGGEPQLGSNAWVVAGRLTATDRPLLANDMHLEPSIPGIWHSVHLRAAGLNAAGVTAPGLPGVIAGHNEHIAWGITNLPFDVQDLYQEELDPRTGRYRFRGEWRQARAERDAILVRGRKPVETANWVTGHGPLWRSEGGKQLALRWIGAEPGLFQYPFLELNRARDWQQFRAALSRLPAPASNFVYADIEGNIGYQAAGRMPVRRNFAGDVPVDGASGEYEWEGFIPFDRLPSVLNPSGGLIVSANQNPFPPGYPFPVNGGFSSPHRARQAEALLRARQGWRAADMLVVQKDVYSSFEHFLAHRIVAAADRVRAPGLEEAVSLLRGWNGQMEKDLAAPLIVSLAYLHMRRAVAERAAPKQGALYTHFMAPSVIERLLRERPEGWFADWDKAVLAAFSDALDEGRRRQGRTIGKWRYGAYLRLNLAHPVGHHLPLVGRYFDLGPFPLSGSGTTVKQTTARAAPSMRMVADLSAWDNSLLNLPVGESGHVLSRHYKDQWEHHYTGRSFPMLFLRIPSPSTLEFR